MRNKKILGALLAVTTLATFGLAGCGNSGSNGAASKEDDKTITVAASPTPHAEILNKAVKPLVEKDGYKLVVKEFTDYVQPNTATEDGEVDANYFQHKPYLDNFNKEKGTHLVSVEGIHFEPFGLYPGKTKELKDMEGRIRGDIWYIEHWSFGLDLFIIYKTVANAIHGEKNAY